MKNRKNIYLILLLFLASIGLTYAYFSIEVAGNEFANNITAETGILSIEYIDGPQISIIESMPGESVTKTFTVENNGTLNSVYDIRWGDIYNEILNDELVVYYDCVSYINYGELNQAVSGTCNDLNEKVVSSTDKVIGGSIPISVGYTHKYSFTIKFLETNEDQNYNQGKKFIGSINIIDTNTPCSNNLGTNSIVVPSIQVDEINSYDAFICLNDNSNLNLSKTKYFVSRYATPYGTNSPIWSEADSIDSASYHIYEDDLDSGIYYIHVLTENTDESRYEMISSPIDVIINEQKRVRDLEKYALARQNINEPVILNNLKFAYDFTQLWAYDNSSYSDIYKNLKALKRAEYEGVILSNISTIDYDGTNINLKDIYYESHLDNIATIENTVMHDQVLDYFFDIADELDMKIYIGLPLSQDWYQISQISNPTWVSAVNGYVKDVVDEVYDKYNERDSYAGWYYSNELYTNNENYEAYFANIIGEIIDHINTLENRGQVIISPFLSSYMFAELSTIQTNWTTLINDVNFQNGDIFALQDGYGTSQIDVETIGNIIKTLRNVIKSKTGVNLLFYSNIENFRTNSQLPGSFDRVSTQIELASYVSDGLFSFSYSHYYSPFAIFNDKDNKYYYDVAYRSYIGQEPLDVSPITIIEAPENGTLYTDSNGDTAPIPFGFTVSSVSSEQTIDTGLVIKDAYDNEYVWIPVNYGVASENFDPDRNANNIAYYRYYSNETYPISSLSNDTFPLGVTSDIHQIEKYKGFYVGRYESSFRYYNNMQTIQIKKSPANYYANQSFIPQYADGSFYDGYLLLNANYSESKILAESMTTAYGYPSNVKSGMINGTMWDTLLKYLSYQNTNYLHYLGASWGNYINSISPANTGSYESNVLKGTGLNVNWKAKNIYDIAGNCREWTSELYNGNTYMLRDVGYTGNGQVVGPSIALHTASYAFNDVAIRVVLYIE